MEGERNCTTKLYDNIMWRPQWCSCASLARGTQFSLRFRVWNLFMNVYWYIPVTVIGGRGIEVLGAATPKRGLVEHFIVSAIACQCCVGLSRAYSISVHSRSWVIKLWVSKYLVQFMTFMYSIMLFLYALDRNWIKKWAYSVSITFAVCVLQPISLTWFLQPFDGFLDGNTVCKLCRVKPAYIRSWSSIYAKTAKLGTETSW